MPGRITGKLARALAERYEPAQARPKMPPLRFDPGPFLSLLTAHDLPAPFPEHVFKLGRRWAFDFAWPGFLVALEVQGGIWTRGRHVRGAALLAEWEKLNAAACMGWRILYCQPKDLNTGAIIPVIREALEYRA
jgi:hypothetical protein